MQMYYVISICVILIPSLRMKYEGSFLTTKK